MATIVINIFPNISCELPSFYDEVAVSFLSDRHSVNLKYWNIEIDNLLSDFYDYFSSASKEYLTTSLFVFSYFEDRRQEITDNISRFLSQTSKFSIDEIYSIYCRFHLIINEHVRKELGLLKDADYFGVISGYSPQSYQWIIASLMAKSIKEINPKIKTFICGTKSLNQASALYKAFPYWDYVLWGDFPESKTLDTNNNGAFDLFDGLTNVNVYQYTSSFDRYIEARRSTLKSADQPFHIPVVFSKGCKWSRCSFCSFKNSVKKCEYPVEAIAEYMKRNLAYTNSFTSLDLNILNYNNIEQLSDRIAEQNIPLFIRCVVGPKQINKSSILCLEKLNVNNVFIGIESFSDNGLTLMNKEHNVFDNMRALKLLSRSHVREIIFNIIADIPGENEAIVKENISNLKFFRFYINRIQTKINVTHCLISMGTKFYSTLKQSGELSKYNFNPVASLFPNSVFENKHMLFSMFNIEPQNKPLWKKFSCELEKYQLNEYRFKIEKNNTDNWIYKEFVNGNLVTSLPLSKYDVEILNYLAIKHGSINDMRADLKMNGISEMDTRMALDFLVDNALVLKSGDEYISVL